ncbi:MAG: LysE family translocator, partial [Gemmobacter sp.]
MTPETLAALAAIAFASCWTPGPNNAMLASSGATFGLARTIPHLLGVALGFPVMAVIVGLFLGEAFQRSALLQEGLRWGGAALLLWVAWKIATAGGMGRAGAAARPLRLHEAAAFQWINAKAWVMNSFFIDAVTVTPVPGGGALSCEFQPGDGIGGTESQVGEAPTAQACMQM